MRRGPKKKHDTQASLRLSPELKDEIRVIARAERRTLSNCMQMLLRSAVRNYQRRQKNPPRSVSESERDRYEHELPVPSEEVLARRVAEIILAGNLLGKGSGRVRKHAPGFLERETERKRA